MHDQQHHDVGVSEDGADFQMLEAVLQAALEIQPGEERLKHDQTGEGGQLLVLEADLRQCTSFSMNVRLANLHRNGLFAWWDGS